MIDLKDFLKGTNTTATTTASTYADPPVDELTLDKLKEVKKELDKYDKFYEKAETIESISIKEPTNQELIDKTIISFVKYRKDNAQQEVIFSRPSLNSKIGFEYTALIHRNEVLQDNQVVVRTDKDNYLVSLVDGDKDDNKKNQLVKIFKLPPPHPYFLFNSITIPVDPRR